MFGNKVHSGNPLCFCVYALNVVLPGEIAAEYDSLLEQFIRSFLPRDTVESAMVRDLVTLLWKKTRFERLEHVSLLRELGLPYF